MPQQSAIDAEHEHSQVRTPAAFGEKPSIDLSRLLSVVRLQTRFIIWVTLGFTIAAGAIAMMIRNSYTASASIVPPTSGSGGLGGSIAGQLSALGISGGSVGIKSNADLYVGMLGSRSIATDIVTKFNLMHVYNDRRLSDAIIDLAKRSQFEAGVRDNIITLKVTDHDPQRSADLANAYLDELQKTNGRLAVTESAQRRLFYEQQLAREKDTLANAEVDLRKLEEQTGFVAPVQQTTVQLQTLAQTRAAIATRQVALAGLLQSSTDQNPKVRLLRGEIANLQGQLAQLDKGTGKSEPSSTPTSRVPELQLEYVRQEREVKYHEALFEVLAKQYESARLDESHDPTVLQILDYATVPDRKSGPPRPLIVGAGFLLGFLVSCFWVILRSRVVSFSST